MRATQSAPPTNKKIGKRTYTLKELAQRDFTHLPKERNTAPIFNLVNIQEDLLDGQQTELLSGSSLKDNNKGEKIQSLTPNDAQNLILPIKLVNQLITKEIAKTADALELDAEELQAWINLQVMTPSPTLLALLRIAREHQLDPLK